MTRTDALIAAITVELDRNRLALDNDVALESVTLTVRLDARRGIPKRVVFAHESAREL